MNLIQHILRYIEIYVELLSKKMENEAKELEKKAEQLNKKGFLASFFGTDNTDEIINCYNLAANKYKLSHKC